MIHDFESEIERLNRHLSILRRIIEKEPIGIVRLSNETGFAHHKVRYSLRLLENENLIEPSSNGAITTEKTATFLESHQGKIDEIINQIEKMRFC